jgi:hypothetical protein
VDPVLLLVTYCRALLAYVVSYSFLYGVTQWFQDGRGLSAGEAGLVTLPLFAIGIVVLVITGRRQGLRGKLLVASAGQLVACGLLLALHPSSPVWILVLVTLVFGIPQGLNSIALQNAVYRQANPDDIAASAGLLRTFGYLGAIIASAAQAGFYGERANTPGMHHLALFLIGASVAFLLITVLDVDYRVIVLSDCVADSDPEVNRLLLDKVLPIRADVIDSAQYMDSLHP